MISKDEGSVLGSRHAVTAVLLLLAAGTLACTRYGIAKSDKLHIMHYHVFMIGW
jgi:hypothetical protein